MVDRKEVRTITAPSSLSQALLGDFTVHCRQMPVDGVGSLITTLKWFEKRYGINHQNLFPLGSGFLIREPGVDAAEIISQIGIPTFLEITDEVAGVSVTSD